MTVEMAAGRGLLLTLILTPFLYMGLEILARRVRVDDAGVTVSKFLRTVRLDWSNLQSLDAMKVGAKVYVILLSESGRPIFITNTICPFKALTQDLIERAPADTVTSNARELLADPPAKQTPFIQACVVCVAMIAMLVGRLLGYGG